ncbi:hypothetical protein SAMN05660464_2518 [Geodermatophilus dictyosporus]|uniref:Uncharacterized protein n=1 Tax=Geodermatophilus dictyosporus TaxID=1523247 RepID=A0A1I5NHZ6_9ACTN|nr:hypothetical protein SAMN05660464_2518 [Geodermatophilus dictyosporus]
MGTEAAGRQAAERATSAGRRSRELSERLVRPSTGDLPDTGGAERARARSETAAEHARESLEWARRGHDRAAGHRCAADHDRRAAAEHASEQTEEVDVDESR